MASAGMAAAEILIERFFTTFRSLYTSRFDAQMALSKAGYRLCPIIESGETFISCFVADENLEEFLSHQDKFLTAAKLVSLDGLDVVKVNLAEGEKPYKLLRVQ